MIGSTDPKANLKNKLNLTFAAQSSFPPYASKGQIPHCPLQVMVKYPGFAQRGMLKFRSDRRIW